MQARAIHCHEALLKLEDYLDRELRLEELSEIERHLETCAACAREFAFEASVLAGLKAKLHVVELPAELERRIHALLKAAAPPEPENGREPSV